MESVNAKVKIPPGLPFCKGRRNNAKGVEGKEGFSTIVGEEEIAAPDEAGLAMTGRRGSVQGSVLSVQGGRRWNSEDSAIQGWIPDFSGMTY
jgi:hypothetical protein